jgi:hypothetical protein
VARDLFRYTYGRLSEPPLPAGLLPGETPLAVTQLHRHVPAIYQRMQAKPGQRRAG